MKRLGPLLGDAFRLTKPYFVSEERAGAWALLISFVALNLLVVGTSVALSYWGQSFFNAVQERRWDSFVRLALTWETGRRGVQLGFAPLVSFYIAIYVARAYLQQWLTIRWRNWLTEKFVTSWLTDKTYWRLFLTPEAGDAWAIDNPDQRIAEDLAKYTDKTIQFALDTISNVASTISFFIVLWSLSGPLKVFGVNIPGYLAWVGVAYAATGVGLTYIAGRPLIRLDIQRQKAEADFRFGLARLRENYEAVALYGGEAQERGLLQTRFAGVVANWRGIMGQNCWLNAVTVAFDQISVIFPFVAAAPGYFAGALSFGVMMQTAGGFRSLEMSLGWYVRVFQDLADWRATLERISAFDRAMQSARAQAPEITIEACSDEIELCGLAVRLPDGETLLHDGSLRVASGHSVAIMGPSGVGKSTLFRALAGLWPFGGGKIRRARDPTLFLPQRPYFPLGTLRDAVAYPLPPGHYDGAELRQALEDVGLAHLVPRLDDVEPWGQRLSGGEQQRLAIARGLLARPRFLFLDEATANLDAESEAALYETLMRKLPDAAIVSVTHRAEVGAFHDRLVRLANRTLAEEPSNAGETAMTYAGGFE